MVTRTADELRSVVQSIVRAVGTSPENAAMVADLLVRSHLAGHDSHGIQHLPRYIEEVRAGEIVPDARPELISETAGATLVRGNWAWGHVTAQFVTGLGIEKAREAKIALVSAVEVNHIGRLGDYVEQAAREGIVTILVSGGHAQEKAVAVPYGGRKTVLAPNPIGIGFPTAEDGPVVVDFATTQVAGGKVALAQAKGKQLPPGCIIDKDGQPSTDPNDYSNGGALLPFGAHKGFGIMVATEILGRVLAGADAYADTDRGGRHFRHAGISLIAIDSTVFSSSREFAQRTTELVTRIRAVPPAPEFVEVLAPGDFEERARTRRKREGIQIPESTWSEVVETAKSLGLEI